MLEGQLAGLAGKLAKGEHPMAPAFTLQRLDGSAHCRSPICVARPVSRQLLGLVVRSRARQEAPALQSAYLRYRKQGLVVLGVDLEDLTQDARHFVKRFGVTYPVVRDTRKETIGRGV